MRKLITLHIGGMTVLAEVPLPWEKVPSGALVRVLPDTQEFRLGHALRLGDFGQWIDSTGDAGRRWAWKDGDWGGLVEQLQIVALDLTGDETSNELLEHMLAASPSVEPLLQAWWRQHRWGRILKFDPGEVRAAFRPSRSLQ